MTDRQTDRRTDILPRHSPRYATCKFRLAVLAYRCQHNVTPRYLTAQLQQASNVGYRQRLRSSSSAKLEVRRTEHVTIGGRAFSSTAAHAWNSLSTAVQSSESMDIFRRRLKTELFESSSCPFSRWWISAILDFRGPKWVI